MAPWQEAVPVEDLGPAYDRYGSIATEEAEAAGRVCPLCARKRTWTDATGMFESTGLGPRAAAPDIA